MKKLVLLILSPLILFLFSAVFAKSICQQESSYRMGAGIYDITGPAAEQGMMGYGMIQQKTAGISQRLWSRAFIIESVCSGKRVVLVNADLGQVFQAVKMEVVKRLQKKYANQYSDDNVLITATHTHSGPGGYSTDAFYNITTFGFDRKHFDTIVDGIVESIRRAEKNLKFAQIKIAAGQLTGISFNRSPQAYQRNPASERVRYAKDVDTEMTLLRFDTVDHQPIGIINWFPLHGVSLNNQNLLISGDNKGYAEYLFEQDFNSAYDSSAFVAAFAQAHAGDVSPNPYGQGGKVGADGLKAVQATGAVQYRKAKQLYQAAKELVHGSIDYRHRYVAMDQVSVDGKYTDGLVRHTCPAAIGVSMLAGTQDGEGVGQQGISCGQATTIFSSLFCGLSTTECQGVKPIALATGSQKPYPWTPNILPLQLIKIGNVIIVAAPFELTTMTGRRIREAIQAEFPDEHIVLSALANAYAGYVTTREEYDLQRYEAASTHFGPWQQAALLQEFVKLAQALKQGQPVASNVTPPDLLDKQINLQSGVWFDDVPLFKDFGSTARDVRSVYSAGDTVEAVFWGAHPRNDYRTQDTFLAVQQWVQGRWYTIRRDRDFDTEYHWQRSGLSASQIKIVWRTEKGLSPGLYRIQHYGHWKTKFGGQIRKYRGTSSTFRIVDQG